MKCVLTITGLVVLCVGLSILAQDIVLPKRPDLVILEVTYEETVGGDFYEHKFGIRIKNIGSGEASLTKAAILIAADITKPWLFAAVDVSPIAAGATRVVSVSRWLSFPLGKCCVIVVVDAPVAGSPLGQSTEGFIDGTQMKGERNNGFVFFHTPLMGLQRFKNPAFEP